MPPQENPQKENPQRQANTTVVLAEMKSFEEKDKKAVIDTIEKSLQSRPTEATVREIGNSLRALDKETQEKYLPKIEDYYFEALQSVEKDYLHIDFLLFFEIEEDLRLLYALASLQTSFMRRLRAESILAMFEEKTRAIFANNPEKLRACNEYAAQNLIYNKKLKGETYSTSSDEIRAHLNQTVFTADSTTRYKFTWDNEVWYLNYFFMPKLVQIFTPQNPGKMLVKPLDSVKDFLFEGNLVPIMEELEANYKNENENKHELEKFDLPKEGKIRLISVFPRSYDSVIAANLSGAIRLGETLKQRYSNLEVAPLIYTDSPLDALDRTIADSYKQGVRTFYLDINNHGLENEVSFKDPLSADDLVSLAEKYEDADFVIGSISCFGGGLAKGFLSVFEKHPEFKKRFAIFLQTKPDVPNYAGIIRTPAGTETAETETFFSTYYQTYFLQAIQNGLTFGQAAAYADQMVKEKSINDAEEIIDGKLISQNKRAKLSDETSGLLES